MPSFVPKKNKGIGVFVCFSDEWILHGGTMQRTMLNDEDTAINANDFTVRKSDF